METTTPRLGQELSRSIDETSTLIAATRDQDRVTELLSLRAQMIRQLSDLVDARLDAASAEYRNATVGLYEANEAIREARQGLSTLAQVISMVSRAVDLVGVLI